MPPSSGRPLLEVPAGLGVRPRPRRRTRRRLDRSPCRRPSRRVCAQQHAHHQRRGSSLTGRSSSCLSRARRQRRRIVARREAYRTADLAQAVIAGLQPERVHRSLPSTRRCGTARRCSDAGDRRRQRDRVSANRLVARPARRGTTLHGTSAGNGDRGTAGPARDPRARGPSPGGSRRGRRGRRRGCACARRGRRHDRRHRRGPPRGDRGHGRPGTGRAGPSGQRRGRRAELAARPARGVNVQAEGPWPDNGTPQRRRFTRQG